MEEPSKMAEWEVELLANGDTKYFYEQYLKPFEYIAYLEAKLKEAPQAWELQHLERSNASLIKDLKQLNKLAKAQAKYIKEII